MQPNSEYYEYLWAGYCHSFLLLRACDWVERRRCWRGNAALLLLAHARGRSASLMVAAAARRGRGGPVHARAVVEQVDAEMEVHGC
jgi:hypothetical protein